MTATGHALIGLALAAQIPDPRIGIPIAILSHIAADAFPHWDTGTNMKKKSFIEFVVGSFIDLGISLTLPFVILAFFFPTTNPIYLFIMIIAAQSFDWATAPYNFLNWKSPPFNWFHNMQIHFDNRLDKPAGIIGQVVIVLAILGFAYFL